MVTKKVRWQDYRGPLAVGATPAPVLKCPKGHVWRAGLGAPAPIGIELGNVRLKGLCPYCIGERLLELFGSVGIVEEVK